jgi:hypothetical protein
MPYRDAVRWVILNDDVHWLDGEDESPSVTACYLADIYGRDTEETVADLRRAKARERRSPGATIQKSGYRVTGSSRLLDQTTRR